MNSLKLDLTKQANLLTRFTWIGTSSFHLNVSLEVGHGVLTLVFIKRTKQSVKFPHNERPLRNRKLVGAYGGIPVNLLLEPLTACRNTAVRLNSA